MSRILFFSDTHGGGVLEAVESVAHLYDLIVFLGDGVNEVLSLKPQLGSKLVILKGNCDFGGDYPNEKVIEFMGVRIFVTHGNAYSVKIGLSRIYYRAKELQCEIVVFGHTHCFQIEEYDGITLFNVGSLNRNSNERGYGVIEFIDKKYYPQSIIF